MGYARLTFSTTSHLQKQTSAIITLSPGCFDCVPAPASTYILPTYFNGNGQFRLVSLLRKESVNPTRSIPSKGNRPLRPYKSLISLVLRRRKELARLNWDYEIVASSDTQSISHSRNNQSLAETFTQTVLREKNSFPLCSVCVCICTSLCVFGLL